MLEPNQHDLIDRFEQLLRSDQIAFFDVEELEEITDYYLDLGQTQSAEKAIKLGLQLYPQAPTFVVKRARLLIENNQMQDARKALEHAGDIAPEHPDLDWIRGMWHLRLGQHDMAIESLKRAVKKVEDPYPVYAQLAALHSALGHYDQALECLKIMLKEEPEDEHLLFLIANNYDMADDAPSAVTWFEAYIEKYPYSESAWYHLANAQHRQGELEAARRALDYALIIDEDFAAAHFDMGRVLEGLERYTEAIPHYERAMTDEQPAAYTLYRIALCLAAIDRRSEAILTFKRAITLDEDLAEAWVELAFLYREEGRLMEAVSYAKRAIKASKHNPEYMVVIIELYQQLGLFIESEKVAEQCMDILGEDSNALIDFGLEMIELGHSQGIKTLLDVALIRMPGNVNLWAFVTGFYLDHHDHSMGVEYYRQGHGQYGDELTASVTSLFPHLAETIDNLRNSID